MATQLCLQMQQSLCRHTVGPEAVQQVALRGCPSRVTLLSSFSHGTVLRLRRRAQGGKVQKHHGTAVASLPLEVAGDVMLPPFQDKFLPHLAKAAQFQQERGSNYKFEGPPLLDLVQASMAAGTTMNAPAAVERGADYGEHRPTTPPPDLPSLLLSSRIVYIGMPLVPAVSELLIAQFLYLQYLDPRQPIYVYVNSSGTSRADGETVGMETEGFAIYDTMMHVKNEIQCVGVGVAIGQACLLLAAGAKGKRYMLPHATAMIQQPRLPSTGLMQAIDVNIRAREVLNNRDTLTMLLARHTNNSFEKVAKSMERPYYMSAQRAMEFGVADKILWRGQEAMAEVVKSSEWDRRGGVRQVERPSSYGAGERGLG